MFTPRALLFDMDGLMIDSEPLWFEVERDLARARGGDWTLGEAQEGAGGGLRRAVVRISDKLVRGGGAPLDPEAGVAELVERFMARLGELRLKPGCAELIATARVPSADGRQGPLPIAVASSNVRRLVLAVLARFELLPLFDAVVAGDEVPAAKPAPDVFLEAARRLGVGPAGCVVLEDAVAGATAGKAAGMHVIAVPEAGHSAGVAAFTGIADAVVSDLFAARQLLRLPSD